MLTDFNYFKTTGYFLFVSSLQLKKVVHPNLALFYGLCDEPGYCSVITEYCSKGPLKDIIHDENVQLDWMFKLSLISDIAKVYTNSLFVT